MVIMTIRTYSATVFRHIPNDQEVSGYRVICFNDDEGDDNVPLRVGSERQRFLSVVTNTASLPQIHIQHYVVWPERNDELSTHLW